MVCPFRAQNSIVAAIDWHAYSQLILRPFGIIQASANTAWNHGMMRLALFDSVLYTGWTFDFCPDEERLREVGNEMSSRIFAVSICHTHLWALYCILYYRFMA